MDVLPWVFTSGWASGINGYAVVLLLGLFGRFGDVAGVPPLLQRTDVLVLAGVLTAIDLVADKIPYVDTVWDLVHTVIRPVIGAAVAAMLAGHSGTPAQFGATAVGGLTALASHTVKSGLRAALNISPDPVSNLIVSTAEDGTVTGVIWLLTAHPWVAASVSAALLAGGVAAVLLLLHRIRRWYRERRRQRLERRTLRVTTGPPG